jgi:signal transduction histidine kinase
VRRRLLASYLSITLFVLIALGLPLGVSYDNTEHRRLVNDVQQDAFAFAQRAGALVDDDAAAARAKLDVVVDEFARDMDATVVVTGRDGEVVVASPRSRTAASTPAMVLAKRGIEVTDTFSDPHLGSALGVAIPVVVGGQIEGAVLVARSKAPTEHRIQNNWLLLTALGGVIALVVLLVSTLLARSFTKALVELDRGAARLGEGDLAVRVEVPDDPPELSGLARSFNATAERLEALVRSQQSFVADASHQLRTPLAALRLRLENLEADGIDSRPEDIERALAEVQRLSQLVDSLLVLTRAEATRRMPESIDLGAVVADRCDAWSAFAAERGVAIDADAPPIQVRSVPGRVEQILDNLLSNALEVAPEGSAVQIDVRRAGTDAHMEVRDAGPGMTPEQRARAFDRFWRAGAARRDGGGFGLGLAIVRELVNADGGTVVLDDAPEGGLRVSITLPLANGVAPSRDERARDDRLPDDRARDDRPRDDRVPARVS